MPKQNFKEKHVAIEGKPHLLRVAIRFVAKQNNVTLTHTPENNCYSAFSSTSENLNKFTEEVNRLNHGDAIELKPFFLQGLVG